MLLRVLNINQKCSEQLCIKELLTVPVLAKGYLTPLWEPTQLLGLYGCSFVNKTDLNCFHLDK